MNEKSTPRLTVFQSECGITISFGDRTYFIDQTEAFHNIASKSVGDE